MAGYEGLGLSDSVKKTIEKLNAQKNVQRYGDVGESVCPHCKGKVVRQVKGRVHQGCRVYLCLKCNQYIASPTVWAYCDLKGVIGKDLFVNDCKVCEKFSAVIKDKSKSVEERKRWDCEFFSHKLKPDEQTEVKTAK